MLCILNKKTLIFQVFLKKILYRTYPILNTFFNGSISGSLLSNLTDVKWT